MGKREKWFSKRRVIQLMSALLYNANAKGFLKGSIFTGASKGVCVPGLNCYSCPGAVGACPLGSLQHALAGANKRLPFYLVGTLLLFGLILGRTVCGFLCPFGLIQELLYKIPTPKLPKNRITKAFTWVKYAVLAVLAIGIPLLAGYPAFCKYICPQGTLEGGILLSAVNSNIRSALGSLFLWKLFVLVVIVTAAVFVYRAFCRFLCPLGALYGLFARVSLLGVRLVPSRCNHCGNCTRTCKMDVRQVGDAECIHCGECISACSRDAIQWKRPQIHPYSALNTISKSKEKP